MLILLDECVPRPLGKSLSGHQVRTVQKMGWAGKRNSALLQLMSAAKFDVLLTVDQSIRFQQNLAKFVVGVIVLKATSNKLKDLLPLVPAAQAALTTIQPGDYVEIP
ncbi:MAG: hypothetical protein HY040_22655 [Planctomycetes bacterium]|nr:hypothetical protein [Planctomycetota bacterium]